MNDRIPGSSYDNPVWYGKWRIYLAEPEYGAQFMYQYIHDDYDGAEDARDHRFGYARSVEFAKAAIDEYEEEHGG